MNTSQVNNTDNFSDTTSTPDLGVAGNTEAEMPGKPKKTKMFVSIGVALVLAVVIAVGAIILIPLYQKAQDYKTADTYFQMEQYEQAMPLYLELSAKEYKDSLTRYFECRYLVALKALENGELEKAEAEFSFLAGKSYKDSAEKVKETNFKQGLVLLEASNYVDALSVFESLKAEGFTEAEEKIIFCTNMIDYLDAKSNFKKKKFYSAYRTFENLGNFKDSRKLRKRCVQSSKSRVLKYSSKKVRGSVSLVIKGLKYNKLVYFEIRSAKSGKVAATLLLKKGGSVRLKMKAGKYKVYADGGSKWFGNKEKLGADSDTPILLYFDRTKTSIKLQNGSITTLTIRSF